MYVHMSVSGGRGWCSPRNPLRHSLSLSLKEANSQQESQQSSCLLPFSPNSELLLTWAHPALFCVLQKGLLPISHLFTPGVRLNLGSCCHQDKPV